MKGRRLLITGAAGFTGRHAVNFFAAEGAKVSAVVRRPTIDGVSISTLFPEGVEVYVCDLSDRSAVAEMIKEATPLCGNLIPDPFEPETIPSVQYHLGEFQDQ